MIHRPAGGHPEAKEFPPLVVWTYLDGTTTYIQHLNLTVNVRQDCQPLWRNFHNFLSSRADRYCEVPPPPPPDNLLLNAEWRSALNLTSDKLVIQENEISYSCQDRGRLAEDANQKEVKMRCQEDGSFNLTNMPNCVKGNFALHRLILQHW